MPKIVCTQCQCEFRPKKNGVWLTEMAEFGPYRVWAADLWECPGCGTQVISGFANEPTEHFEKGFDYFYAKVHASEKEYFDYEHPKERA
jgi:hypothetical protein